MYVHADACKGDDPSVHHVEGFSGAVYDVRLPSLRQMALYGEIPNPLAPMVMKLEDPEGGLDLREASPEEQRQFDDLQTVVVASMAVPPMDEEYVRGYRVAESGKGEPVEPQLPKDDRDQLWNVAIRRNPIGPLRDIIEEQNKAALDVLLPFLEEQKRVALLGNGKVAGKGPQRRARNRG